MNTSRLSHGVIMIVEDDALLRELLTDIFAEEGFDVIAAADAQQAVQQLEATPVVNLLFTDVQMPGKLDGIGLVHLVWRRWPEIASIISSGRVQPRDEDLPPRARFIAKPWTVTEVLRQVEELL